VLIQLVEQRKLLVDALSRSSRAIRDALENVERSVVQRALDVEDTVAELRARVNELEAELAYTRQRIPGAPIDFGAAADEFVRRFRGTPDEMRRRFESTAEQLVGFSPVLDLGFGDGEMISLLNRLGVEALGVERDESLVATALERGLDVTCGDRVEYLRDVPDRGLGALVMFQVVEHLAACDA